MARSVAPAPVQGLAVALVRARVPVPEQARVPAKVQELAPGTVKATAVV